MKIEAIEGIGPVFAKKLRAKGVRSTGELLKRGASKKGRASLAAKTDISETLILEWVNLADLMRIKGIGEEYSDLLEEAGVDTIKELRNRVGKNLYEKMLEVNAQKRLVRRTPTLAQVEDWVKQAKSIQPTVTY
jgi:predicted flap endonuclease-1-like 5' DNA nuclease